MNNGNNNNNDNDDKIMNEYIKEILGSNQPTNQLTNLNIIKD